MASKRMLKKRTHSKKGFFLKGPNAKRGPDWDRVEGYPSNEHFFNVADIQKKVFLVIRPLRVYKTRDPCTNLQRWSLKIFMFLYRKKKTSLSEMAYHIFPILKVQCPIWTFLKTFYHIRNVNWDESLISIETHKQLPLIGKQYDLSKSNTFA